MNWKEPKVGEERGDNKLLVLDELSDRLSAFRQLSRSDDESATDTILGEFGARGRVELDIVRELSARKPLWLPDRFEEAHHLVIRSLEVLDRHGGRATTMPRLGPLTPVDSDFVQQARRDYVAVINLILTSSSAHVVFIKPPLINPYWMDVDSESRDPVVHGVMERLMGELVAEHPDRLLFLDMRAWLEGHGLDQEHAVRPDGIHFGPDGALDVVTRWLGPELVIEATRTTSG